MSSHPTAASAQLTHRENRRSAFGVLVAMLGCAAAFLGIGAPAASAATAANSFVVSPIGPFGPGGGNFTGYSELTVSPSSGNIFFGQSFFGHVSVYAPDPFSGGTPILSDYDVYSPSSPNVAAQNVAVDPSDETLYVDQDANIPPPGVAKFTSDGQPTPTYTYDSNFFVPPPTEFVRTEGMAVDPVTHDLLVADSGAGAVFRFSSSGTFIEAFKGGGTLQSPVAVAVAPSGAFYVVDSASASVQRYSAAGASLGALPITSGAQPSAITVNPVTGEVAVFTSLNGQGQVEVFDAAGTRLVVAGTPSIAEAHGLGWDGSRERIYLDAGNATAYVLVPAIQPGVDAPVVETSGRNIAHVTAKVAPGGEPTTAWIEYCPAEFKCSAYSSSNPSDPHNPWKRGPLHEGLSGSGEETIEDDLPLTSNTEWKLRTSAQNAATSNRSAETTFFSPLLAPTVETGPAGSVTELGAVLSGTIETLGDQTTYHFEYGLTESYGSRVPAAGDAPAGDNRIPRVVSKPISDLQAGTTYHYRLVAENSAGSTAGADRTFTTPTPDEAFPKRVYEQVTPTDKEGALVNSDFHTQVAPDGNAISVVTASGATDSQTVNIRQNFMIRRGATDWLDWVPVDPPQTAMGGIFEAATAALSPDFNHALVISNRVLAPGGAFEGGGNLYVKDLRTGEYSFVGGAPGVSAYQAFTSPASDESIYITGAPDFSWILINSFASLLPGVPDQAVYRWSESDGLSVESLLPGDVVPTDLMQVATKGVPDWQTASEDGSVVYFGTDLGGGPGVLYRRENGETTLVSHPEPGNPGGLPVDVGIPATLDSVSSDGRYAVFHPQQADTPLTADAPNGSIGIYRYDSVSETIQYLTDQSGNSQLLAVSDDANTVYIERASELSGGPIVVWRDGVVKTVSSSGSAGPDASAGAPVQNVSPNGRYFAWIKADGTLQLYDAEADETVCVSCPSDGSPAGTARTRSAERGIGNRGPEVINNEGLLLFDSPAQLTTEDHNGSRDVYAYQHGRLTLISPGNADYDAQFVDASADGRDVFFQTEQSLVSQDTDGSTDVYDARVGGGFASQSPASLPPPCVRSDCGGTSNTSPEGPAIGSMGSGGSGKVAAPRINGIHALSASDRAKLAKGKKVRLKVKVSGPGKVTLTGSKVTRGSAEARAAGTVGAPFALKKSALGDLRRMGTLTVRLNVAFAGTHKSLSIPLKSSTTKKGGRS